MLSWAEVLLAAELVAVFLFANYFLKAAKGWRSLVIVLALVLSVTQYWALPALMSTVERKIPSSGVYKQGLVNDFKVSWFASGVPEVKNVVWGEIEAGFVATVDIYVVNTGDVLLNITFWGEDWVAVNSTIVLEDYMEFYVTTDVKGLLLPDRARLYHLHLHPDADIMNVTEFAFDIVVHGEGPLGS